MQGTWRGAHTHRAVSQKCRGQGTICHCHCRGDLEVLVRAGWFRNLGVSVLVGVLVGHVGEWHPCRSQGCGAGFGSAPECFRLAGPGGWGGFSGLKGTCELGVGAPNVACVRSPLGRWLHRGKWAVAGHVRSLLWMSQVSGSGRGAVLDRSWGPKQGEPWGIVAMVVLQCPAFCVGLSWCSAGAPWEPGGGVRGSPQAALSFHGNSRAEPGNTSSGRKATAARREWRASLAEQAPDTLSVQLSGTASLPGLLLCPWLHPHASQSGLRQPLERGLCSDLGAPGLGDTGVVPWFPGDSWWDGDGLSVCPGWGAVY